MKIRDEEILKKFAKRLKEVRLENSITQEELAYSSGISLSQIARIETARINPTLCTLTVIATTLNISLKDLMDF